MGTYKVTHILSYKTRRKGSKKLIAHKWLSSSWKQAESRRRNLKTSKFPTTYNLKIKKVKKPYFVKY